MLLLTRCKPIIVMIPCPTLECSCEHKSRTTTNTPVVGLKKVNIVNKSRTDTFMKFVQSTIHFVGNANIMFFTLLSTTYELKRSSNKNAYFQ